MRSSHQKRIWGLAENNHDFAMDCILFEMSPIPWSLVKIIRLLNYEGSLKEFDNSFMKGDYGKIAKMTDPSFYYLALRQRDRSGCDLAFNGECCATALLQSQPDFKEQKGWLQELLEQAGHSIVFYLKFHCELNFMERF